MFGSPTSVLGVQSHQISPGGVHLHELGILPLTMLDTTPIPLVSYGGFHGHGESPKWLVCSMENPNLKRDDDWRYPYFRKPPYPLSEWNRTPEYFSAKLTSVRGLFGLQDTTPKASRLS